VRARKQEERKKSIHGKRRKEGKAHLMKGRISKETMMILFFLPLPSSTLQIARNASTAAVPRTRLVVAPVSETSRESE
jgi:hypothetical protein